MLRDFVKIDASGLSGSASPRLNPGLTVDNNLGVDHVFSMSNNADGKDPP